MLQCWETDGHIIKGTRMGVPLIQIQIQIRIYLSPVAVADVMNTFPTFKAAKNKIGKRNKRFLF